MIKCNLNSLIEYDAVVYVFIFKHLLLYLAAVEHDMNIHSYHVQVHSGFREL